MRPGCSQRRDIACDACLAFGRQQAVSTIIDGGFFLVSIGMRTGQCFFVVFIAVRPGCSQRRGIACDACLAFGRQQAVSTIIDGGFFLVSIGMRTGQCFFVVFIAVRPGCSQRRDIACDACLAFGRQQAVSTIIDGGFFLVSIGMRAGQCFFVVFIAVRPGCSQCRGIAFHPGSGFIHDLVRERIKLILQVIC